MKKVISILIALVLTFALFCVPASAAGTGTLALSNAEGKQRDTVTVNVNLNSNPGLITMKFTVSWGDGLELTGVSNSGLLAGWTTPAPTISSPYTLRWADSLSTTNSTKTGKIATLTFKIKDNAPVGNKTVTLTFSESRDANGGKNTFGNATATVKVNCKTHSYGNTYTKISDTQHSRTCSACSNVEKTNHTWNGGTVTKTANCKETGTKTYTCTANGCGATKTETIAKTNNHTYGSWGQTKAPSCTGKGTESRTCSTCQKVETRDISATGHKMGSWMQTKAPTCTTKGTEQRKCTVSGCSHTETRDIAATGHNMGSWKTTKEATCEAKGEQTRSCSKCSHKETEAIDALGHKFSNPTVTKQPTCTETGIESGKCTRCNKETTNTIKATGHSFSDWVDTKAATCTEKGAQEHKCSKCNTVESRETEALGHDFDKPVVIKEPTLTEKGIEEGVCKTCGEKTQAELPCAFKDETTGIEIKTDEGVFQEGTKIKIEVIEKEHTEFEKVKTALKEVGSNFVAYDVSAIRDNVVVQPNGTVTVSFKIPEGFGKNVAVFYISDDGISEKLESAISEDGKSISATLSHFSSYAVVELDNADTETNVDNATDENSGNILWIIIAIISVVVIAGAVITIIFIKKKK